MKKLFLSIVSLTCLCASATSAKAWFFDGCCGCHCYTTKLCIKPYNAFSPVAYGSIVGDGCMPINVYGGGLPCMRTPYGNGGACCAAPTCFTSGCCDTGCLPPAGGAATPAMVPGQPMPQGAPGQQFTPPNPQPLNQGAYMVPMQNPMAYSYGYGYAPVQPVAYQQPMVNPYYYPQQQQAPSYWYGR
jgi:hypothetical protein